MFLLIGGFYFILMLVIGKLWVIIWIVVFGVDDVVCVVSVVGFFLIIIYSFNLGL